MKITLESTESIIFVGGMPARIWSGMGGENNVPVEALIVMVKARRGHDLTEFDAELDQIRREAVKLGDQKDPLLINRRGHGRS